MGVGISPGRRPTRADVARLAKVAPATVSYVLNDDPTQVISEKTRSAVRRAAAALGYRPNLAARSLASGVSGMVLYVVSRAGVHELSMRVVSGLTAELARRGVVLTVQFETGDGRAIAEAVHDLRPIAVASAFPLGEAASAAIASAGIPHVHPGSTDLRGLSTLHVAAAEVQVTHLMSRGHTRLAFGFSDVEDFRPLGEIRLAGVRAACARRGLPEPLAGTLATDGGDAAEVVGRWVSGGVTAACGFDDATALVILHGIRLAGLRCPDDLAVIGSEANPIGYVSDPPLTTISFDAAALVKPAVAILLEALGHPVEHHSADEHVITLVERAST